MKKIFFLFSIVTMLLSTSCLDDNESSMSATNVFGVVQQNSVGGKFVYVNAGKIYNQSIENFSVGDAFIISSYKVSGNTNSSGIMTADELVVGTNYPNRIQRPVLFQEADTASNINDNIGLVALSIRYTSSSEAMYLSRTLMDYRIYVPDGTEYRLDFYYDADKQVGSGGQALADNRRVVDIIVVPTTEGVGNRVYQDKSIVLNAQDLQNRLKPSSTEATISYIDIDFRVSMYTNETKDEYVQTYLPNMLRFSYSSN